MQLRSIKHLFWIALAYCNFNLAWANLSDLVWPITNISALKRLPELPGPACKKVAKALVIKDPQILFSLEVNKDNLLDRVNLMSQLETAPNLRQIKFIIQCKNTIFNKRKSLDPNQCSDQYTMRLAHKYFMTQPRENGKVSAIHHGSLAGAIQDPKDFTTYFGPILIAGTVSYDEYNEKFIFALGTGTYEITSSWQKTHPNYTQLMKDALKQFIQLRLGLRAEQFEILPQIED